MNERDILDFMQKIFLQLRFVFIHGVTYTVQAYLIVG